MPRINYTHTTHHCPLKRKGNCRHNQHLGYCTVHQEKCPVHPDVAHVIGEECSRCRGEREANERRERKRREEERGRQVEVPAPRLKPKKGGDGKSERYAAAARDSYDAAPPAWDSYARDPYAAAFTARDPYARVARDSYGSRERDRYDNGGGWDDRADYRGGGGGRG
ncbi:hypothetical protein G7Y79_00008g024440 [Physcia stellaris]|nr:hypothetical protein G7Y79_00008g024440 [Physcia stellaris]